MTQEFHLSVTPVGQDEYLVRTEQVAPGVPLAEEIVTWPVADWLTQAGQLMNDPLLGLLQGSEVSRSLTGNTDNLVALGQQLYSALFQGTLRDSWVTAEGIAQHTREVLRLRLGLKDTRLLRLPWEVLHAGDRPLATGPYVAFSRYQAGTTSWVATGGPTPSMQQAGVKVLMVIARPRDRDSLALKQEAENLKVELNRQGRGHEAARRGTDIQLTILEQPGREQLTQYLEQGEYQVLHYAGHSNFGPSGGEIYLVSGKTGLTETLSGDDLAGLLVNNGIQMAVFNSCRGAYTATSDDLTADTAKANLAEALVKRGIRSVLAMAERIPDEVALTLTRLFYRNLSQGYPVDLSLSRARQGLISTYGSDQLYWALPILYLQREFDGYLTTNEIPFLQLASSPNESASGFRTAPATYSVDSDDWEALPVEEMTASDFQGFDAAEMGLLDEEGWDDLVDVEYDDPEYEDDSALVSDLFQELAKEPPPKAESSTVSADPVNQLQLPHVASSQTTNSNRFSLAESPIQAPKDQPNKPPSSSGSSPQLDQATPPTTATNPTPSRRRRTTGIKGWLQRTRTVRKVWPVLGVVSVAAIAVLGVWWFQRQPQPQDFLPVLESSNPATPDVNLNPTQVNLNAVRTSVVTASAIEHFNKGDLSAGSLAVEELLKRNAQQDANAALAAVSQRQADDPAITFLRGRLAWQAVQLGDKNYSFDDARRYWETAVKSNPNSVSYRNALGFAYYAEGDLKRANQTWFQALYLVEQQQAKTTAASTTMAPTPSVANHDALNAYAGLALVMSKPMPNQLTDERARLLKEAIKLRQKVMTDDPVNFQPQSLSKNWLWTQKAIQDWQALLKLQAQ